MSSIEKLAIQGIRSFDNSHRETIHFYTPLTLIVGHNGSGKTTIIECLRYATTGDLPPNSKGGAFIHDPKLCGEKDVKAQVKLGFTASNGVHMISTRSMQLTIKKNTRTFKTLEGQLQATTPDGDRRTISTRCAELDAQMPQYLGVSKAVLDYVVFCHQEDSLWPLGEPASLKKRFDEIFEALKYTKALDSIKVLRKEQHAELKFLDQQVTHLKSDKDRADSITARINKLKENVKNNEQEASVLSEQIRRNAERSKELFETSKEFEKVIAEADQLKNSINSIIEQSEALKFSIEILPDSDESLQSRLTSFEEHVSDKRDELVKLEALVTTKKRDIEKARQQEDEALVNEGQLTGEHENYEAQRKSLQAIAREISKQQDIPGFDMILDDHKLLEFHGKLKDNVRKLDQQVQSVRHEATKDIERVQTEINRLENEKSSYFLEIKIHKEGNERQQADLKITQSKESAIQVSEGDVQFDEKALRNLDARLRAAKKEAEDARYAENQASKSSLLKDVEEKIEIVNSEISSSNRQADLRAKVGLLEEEVDKHKAAVDTLIKVHSEGFQKLTGSRFTEGTIETEPARVVDEVESVLADTVKQHDISAKELSKIETRLSTTSKTLASQRQSRQSALDAYYEIAGDTDVSGYESLITERKEELEIELKELAAYNFSKDYLAKAIHTAESTHNCPLCHRTFDGESDSDFKQNLKSFRDLVISISNKMKLPHESESNIEKIRQELESLDSLASDVVHIREFNESIPNLEDEVKFLTEQLDDAGAELEAQRSKILALRNKVGELEKLRLEVSDILRRRREIANLEASIEDTKSEISEAGITRSLPDMDAERIRLTERSSILRKELQMIADEKEKTKTEINRLENKLRDTKLHLQNLRNQLQTKSGFSARITEIKKDISEAEMKIQENELKVRHVTPQIEQQHDNLEKERKFHQKRESDAKSKLQEASKSLSAFEAVQVEIARYESRGGITRLQNAKEHRSRLVKDMKRITSDLEMMSNNRNKLDKDLANMKSQQRLISDNLQFRKLNAQEENVRSRLKALDRKNALEQRKSYELEAQKLRNQHQRYNTQYGGIIGATEQMRGEMANREQELNSTFKNVHSDYRESLIKMKTTAVAIEDLAKYSKALDSAIMKYHSLKMEEINRIIDELWKKTYSGTDVDTILIRSDDENAKGNRSYNYRVCMVKQDTELDMRGRCSAGQKVLASIIIRLALAECFGVNCGLIALDEPTTNLDQENVQSLARSLGSIIETRRAQKNFQLIVITHDEDFLRYMNGSEYCEYYFRLSRDERQKSQIERQKMSDVF
ncbi:AAA domain-containing protein [Lipomyces japonicus]|uniref:AAA domain-containing protein n=1 Tax=Lipomyces japonicus TaxID=56871 RepID=UPI0034CE4A8D